MGVELHITRAEFWAENEGARIDEQEWLNIVGSDEELELFPANGNYYAKWLGESEYDEPWLDWFEGNISTKAPDASLYKKMLSIAEQLGAKVQDDDGNVYVTESDWDTSERQSVPMEKSAKKQWWRFW